jgi:uncharacterized MAPEG superfamily protein
MPLSTSALLLYSLVAAAALVYLPFLVVAYGRAQLGYDVSAPRAMFDKLPPYAQRATWAHQNAFESFMLYSVAALMAYVTQVDSVQAQWAVLAYVGARLLYPLFYVLNIPLLRSLMFAIGSVSIGTLMLSSLSQIGAGA